MMWGPEPMFVRSEMSTPLVQGTPLEPLADFSEGTLDAGQPLGVIEHPVAMRRGSIDILLRASGHFDRMTIFSGQGCQLVGR